MNYDLVIIGAGPGGIFSCYEAVSYTHLAHADILNGDRQQPPPELFFQLRGRDIQLICKHAGLLLQTATDRLLQCRDDLVAGISVPCRDLRPWIIHLFSHISFFCLRHPADQTALLSGRPCTAALRPSGCFFFMPPAARSSAACGTPP